MPNRIFIISDTHFGHKRICEFEPEARPFSDVQQHDDELVYRWNNTVKKGDTVWHLGDVLFGLSAFETLARLNGVKRLVMGNHDHYPIQRYLEHFSTVCGSAVVRNCILTHIPIHQDQFYRFRANLHGHLHSKALADPRYINVSAEHWNLTPALLDTVMRKVPDCE